MRKEKYVYNTHTLRYEKVVEPWRAKLLKIIGFVCAALLTGFIFTLISHNFFPSPKEKALLREIDYLKLNYNRVQGEMEQIGKVLGNLQDRDAYAHRMIFGMDPIDKGVWEGGIGGHDQYEQLRQFRHTGELMASVQEQVDQLKRQMVIQSKSLDTIINLAKEKEEMLASIPSIKPVRSDKLARDVRVLSGFGYRIHPIFKVPRMHWGIDFTAPKGTPIQATGAGRVIKAERGSGYGYHVVIDHGYGYQTLYGHMSRMDVKVGDKVVRGQKIGLVGNTGTSTAPHCHYEIIFRGEKINPIHYCMDGLTPKEYQELVEAAEAANQSLD
ncbi:MAG: M23 family metallopeptidase [Saprospiraceae bacterium]|nr:M23 family metallopeptidase [Saprospiraceae bacterium]